MTSHIQPRDYCCDNGGREWFIHDENCPMKPKSNQQPEASWEEEFAMKFVPSIKIGESEPVPDWGKVLEGTTANYFTLHSFISQSVAEAVEAERKSLEVLYGGPWAVSADQACKELKEESARLKKMISEAILEERRKIVNRIEEEKSKGYEANTILEGLIAELKVGNLIHHQ